MRHLPVSLLCLAVLASACDATSTIPTAPTPVTPRPPAPSPPPAVPRDAVAVDIGLGEVVRSRVTHDDPLCDPAWAHRCRYYRLTAPTSGLLNVAMTWNRQALDPYPLDVDVVDELGNTYFPSVGPGTQRNVWLSVAPGRRYVIGIWSFTSPPEEFELRSSIQPR
jgi:hypothetical protein